MKKWTALRSIMKGIESATNSHAWRERTELMRGIHGVPVHPYTIFYRIADHSPEIVRVLHERRDTASILSPDTK
jgi:plasmid stabilization system protein ParE